MTSLFYLFVTLLVATGIFFGVRYFVRAYCRYRDSRFVTCPETGKGVIVETDAVHAALSSMVGEPDIRLKNCGRWPLNQDCGQECLTQLDVAPAECLVEGVLKRWYDSKECVYCGWEFGKIQQGLDKPALRSPHGKLIEWHAVPIQDLDKVMRTHLPICWNCKITESFRLVHPDLVVYRPWLGAAIERPAMMAHTVTMPKHEEARPKQINVKVN